MDARIFVEPQQGASYDTLLAAAQATEAAGFDAFFRSDHFLKMGDADGLPGPTDAWITLAGLARETSTIKLGTLVTSATFRDPGLLAISVAQVDQMSGGRVELGLGAGWYEAEHTAYGFAFPSLGERFERFEEHLAIVTGLWDTPVGSTFGHDGEHYQVVDSPALPKPHRRPPIIIGGRGPRRTPRLTATYADEFNLPFASMPDTVESIGRVRAACEAIDRDPDELTYSIALVVCGGSDQATIDRRGAAIGREADEMAENGLCGTPEQILDRIGQWQEAGIERVYLQVLDLSDLDHITELGETVLPHL